MLKYRLLHALSVLIFSLIAYLFYELPSVPLMIVHIVTFVPVAYFGYESRYFPKRIEQARRVNPDLDHYLSWRKMMIIWVLGTILYGGSVWRIALEGEPTGAFDIFR